MAVRPEARSLLRRFISPCCLFGGFAAAHQVCTGAHPSRRMQGRGRIDFRAVQRYLKLDRLA
jgi:hypothetical protein